MKHLLLCALTLALLPGCNSRTQTAENQHSDTSAAANSPTEATEPAPLTARLTALGLTNDSHWRGTNLGDAIATVRARETGKGELFEDKPDHLGYAIDLPSLESIDVLYYQSGGNVSAIETDLYLNTQKAVTAYLADLTAHFNGRYGPGKTTGNITNWTDPAGHPVSLKNISAGKDFGIKVRIGAESAATASAR
jgi:hypothetical protein